MSKSKKGSKGQVPSDSGGTLTAQQMLFIHEYFTDMNATKAAIRAGYAESSAYSYGSALLDRPAVKSEMNRIIEARIKSKAIYQERFLRELEAVAFSDLCDAIEFCPHTGKIKMKDIETLEPAVKKAIQTHSETITEFGGTTTLKLHDKLKAMEMLQKYLKLFEESSEDGSSKSSELEQLRKTCTEGLRETLSNLRGRSKLS